MTTSNILMIRPAAFAFNPQTAVNNAFQQATMQAGVNERALREFDDFVGLLRRNGVNVTVVQDTEEPHTPDSVFPNNWVSFHEDGTLVLYPMFAPNRRLERTRKVIDTIRQHFYVRSVTDLSFYEEKNTFLEGTGSMVLDRDNELAYACISPRTDATALYDFCDALGYRPILFNAVDAYGKPIYHTNVMMSIGNEYVVICMESIKEAIQKKMLLDKFEETGKAVIEISLEQMNHFAGNMLQVENAMGAELLVMSAQAFNSLTDAQIQQLEFYNPIIYASLNTIEQNGGGSARCMMAEIFLVLKQGVR
ncbi:MAG: arginine deiminase-related protein [Niabella sp.]